MSKKSSALMSELLNRGETLEDEKRQMEHERHEAIGKFDRLQAMLRSLESFAEDTVRENKSQQEKIAERNSHIIILSETCKDVQEQLVELQAVHDSNTSDTGRPPKVPAAPHWCV